jgi:hypothetical protein
MVKRGNSHLRALCVCVCALLVFSSIDGQTLHAQVRFDGKPPARDGPREGPPPSDHRPGSSSRGNEWIPWAIVGVIGAAAIAARARENNAHVDDNKLAVSGPRFPDSYNVGTFGVQGYVRGGWPIVVDFLPEPETCTWLEVSVDQQPVFSSTLDADGRGGRQLVRIDVPPLVAPGARPAIYVVHSARPICPANRKVPNNSRTPSPIEVYGIGAGPRAVGSVAIDELQFGPPELRRPEDRATIAYRAQSEFNHASVEILRYEEDPPGQINVHRVTAKIADVVSGQNKGDAWDGKNDSGARSLGVHRLQVRAWFTENDKSWVGAISPSSVSVANE